MDAIDRMQEIILEQRDNCCIAFTDDPKINVILVSISKKLQYYGNIINNLLKFKVLELLDMYETGKMSKTEILQMLKNYNHIL